MLAIRLLLGLDAFQHLYPGEVLSLSLATRALRAIRCFLFGKAF